MVAINDRGTRSLSAASPSLLQTFFPGTFGHFGGHKVPYAELSSRFSNAFSRP
jgi:hypothetical protein